MGETFVMEVLRYIEENSTLIKDISTIIFTAIGSVLAILTYIRAKATILQPKRNEVVKRQTEILTDFLLLISKSNNSIDSAFDYVNMFSYNVDLVLREYGLLEINKSSKKYDEINENLGGWIQFLENDIYEFTYMKGDLAAYDEIMFEKDNRKRQKNYNTRAIEGEVIVHRIFYTKQFFTFFEAIRDFSNNPFLPESIHEVAHKIDENLKLNVFYDLRNILKTLVEEYVKASLDREGGNKLVLLPEFRHRELWRLFEKVRKQHDEDYSELKKRIREYLAIDAKW